MDFCNSRFGLLDTFYELIAGLQSSIYFRHQLLLEPFCSCTSRYTDYLLTNSIVWMSFYMVFLVYFQKAL